MRTKTSVRLGVGRLHGRRAGFTLIELLAVMTIILVVVGLLSAALNQTRSRMMRVACLDNMKQLQLAWMLYANDNDDHIALNRIDPNPKGGIAAAGPRLATASWTLGNPKEDKTTDNIKRGSLFPYVDHTDVYRCPMDGSVTKAGNFRTRSYAINAYLGGDRDELDSRVKLRLVDLVNPPPERTFVFIEEHEQSIWAGGFVVLPRERTTISSGTWHSTPSDRHMQGCNLTFADGHLEPWKWLAPKKANLSNQLISNPKELRDLRRLQDCVPKP